MAYDFKVKKPSDWGPGGLQGFTRAELEEMERIRNNEWENDKELRNELSRLIKECLQQKEIICYMKRDFREYAWSERTLKRRIQYFNLSRKDNQNTLDEATNAINSELKGPGQLLGYRAMHQKIRKVEIFLVA